MELLGKKTGAKVVIKNGVPFNDYTPSPYYELSQYFDDEMPGGYWKEGTSLLFLKKDIFNYSEVKPGTLGTIAEDREGDEDNGSAIGMQYGGYKINDYNKQLLI